MSTKRTCAISRSLSPACHVAFQVRAMSGHSQTDAVSLTHYLMAYVRLGNEEQAFAWLERAVEERNWFAFETRVNPILDPLRGDPRFEKIVASLAPK